MIDFGATGIGSQGPRIKGPKMSPFDERHDMGSHIHRFERYAVLQGWRKRDWAVYLAALLKGKALYVYARLPPEHAQDYDELKQALLKRYALTEEGYKQKFYESKQEKGESPQQFLERLDSYFLRWLELAKVPQSFDGVRALMVKERYLATCHKSLEIFLRERPVDDLDELAKLAEQFQDAHGTRSRFSYQKEHQTSSSQRESVSSSSLSKPIEQDRIQSKQVVSPITRQSKPKCYNCGKMGHIANNFLQKAQVVAMVQRNRNTDTCLKPIVKKDCKPREFGTES